MSIILTKFEVDMTIHCRVIAFLSADTSCDLDLWPFDLEQLQFMAGHVTNLATKFEDPMPIRSWLWVITFPVGYPWECVRGHCPPGGQKQLHFWNPRPWFAYSLCNFGGSTMNVMKVIRENNARPCVKRRMTFCACAKSRVLLKLP